MTNRVASLNQNLPQPEHPPGGAATDRQLLECFVRNHDHAAFAALLERHGPMVRGVCQRLLGRTVEADDAFQATFLVLVRRAGSVGWHESIGGWLHAVACRVAHKVRADAARANELARRVAPAEVPTMPNADPLAVAVLRELSAVLDEELARLPEKYRLPLVLCYLEGRTNEEAAQQLGWTKGTVSGRLARARDLLRSRLAHRGLALSAVAFEVALTDAASAGTLPASLFDTTLKAAVNTATGSTAVAEGVSTQALTLAEGVSKAMFPLTRLKLATAVLLAFCVIGTGATLMIYNSSAADPNEEKQNLPPKPKPPTDEEKLQGTWMINNPESLQQGASLDIQQQRPTRRLHSKPEKGIITHYKYLILSQKPKTIDLTIQSGNDGPIVAQIKGIYQLDGDELKDSLRGWRLKQPKAFPVRAAVSVIHPQTRSTRESDFPRQAGRQTADAGSIT